MSRRPAETLGPLLVAGLFAATVPLHAWAQADTTSVAASTEDTGLDAALEHHANGHPLKAVAVLEPLAQQGNLAAMERLALAHWYGERLFGRGPWNRGEAVRWFRQASSRGSGLAQYMLRQIYLVAED